MALKRVYELSDLEIDILRDGIDNPDLITEYFFRPEGAPRGWKMDEKFDPEGAWQKIVHHASQKRIMVIGGFGCGKTKGIALSACVWSITTRDFKFMNCAPAAWQSELMYDFIVDTLGQDTVFGKMIWAKPKRPYPKVLLKFRLHGTVIQSTLEFMSVDKNASSILSWEGDWVNVDEAGLIDDLEGTYRNLGSRLRGTSHIGQRDRLGRMSLCSNSWDNPQLWYRYDLAREDPDDFLSLTISSRHNRNITKDQLKLMLRDVPEDEHDRFIDGHRPEGRGNYFSKNKIYEAEDEEYGQFILSNVNSRTPGYDIRTLHGAGVTYFTVPPAPGHIYMVLGDPGNGDAPSRNAPVLQVWDVTDFPKYKASMVGWWWGMGRGSITPFVVQLLKFMQTYNPIATAVDNTGPQKNTSELLNNYIASARTDPTNMFEWLGQSIDMSGLLNKRIGGLDFSGGRKSAYLVSGRLMIEAMLFTWPKFVTGMRSQLSNYDPEKDVGNKPKIAQDIVATFCMSAFAVQSWFHIDPAKALPARPKENFEVLETIVGRDDRLPREYRELAYSRV